MDERIEQYRKLSKKFSLLPLKHETLSPAVKKWKPRCYKKVKFVDKNYMTKKLGVRNAGIACGPASKIIVVQIKEHDKFEKWCKQNGLKKAFSKTFTVQCGENIKYFYYKYPKDKRIYNTRFDIPGFVVHAVGSFVLAPGSIHPGIGKQYVISEFMPIAPLPQWILDVLQKTIPYRTIPCELPHITQNKLNNPFYHFFALERQRIDSIEGTESDKTPSSAPEVGLVVEDSTNNVSSSDTVGEFIRSMCQTGKCHIIKSSHFNKIYPDWCYENGVIPLGKHSITTDLKGKGFNKKKTKGAEHWIGLKLK